MIDAEMRNAIWTLFKQGKTKKEIARLFDLDKKTVFKIIKNEGRMPEAHRKDKLEPDRALISQVYKQCQGFARRTHEVLTQEYSIEMGYSTLNRLLLEIQAETDKKDERGPPLIVKPGVVMQHDTSPHVLVVGGQKMLLQCAGLYYRYSKVRYIKYYPSFDKFAMKSFMYEAVMFWRYVARECVIDNTSLAVLRGTGEHAVFHEDMNGFSRRLGFKWVAHPLKKPNWKAGMERNFRTVETNFIPGRSFKNMEDLNRQAFEWATEKYLCHPDDKTKLVPAVQWEIEKPYLEAVCEHIEPPYRSDVRMSDKNGFIPMYANYYWIPQAKQEELRVIEYPGRIKVYRNRELLAEYPLKPSDVKYERVAPQGLDIEKKPRNLHLTSEPEEKKLRACGEMVVLYLDFIRSKEGAVRTRNQFVRNLYAISLRLAPGIFQKTIERALAFKINRCDAIERIALQLMRTDTREWPEMTSSGDGFEDREAYQEGRLSDEPDLFSYAKLLTDNDPDSRR